MRQKTLLTSILLLTMVSSSFTNTESASAAEHSADGSSQDTADWNLIWSDEFEADEINMDNWSYDVPANGRWNGEIQSYTDNNAYIEDGSLILEARDEDITEEDGEVYNYSSAKLITQGKQTWTYGRVDVRAKLPEGQGIWPAIWMMPEDEPFYGTWPVSGEIDIMELLGHEPDIVHGTVHYGEPHQQIQGTYELDEGTFADDYHVFSIEWEPGEIRWYIDGHHYHTANDWFNKHPDNADQYTYPAPFDQPFFLILNISIGGGWPGNPDETTTFPQQMAVDYVRVYDKDEYPVHNKPESTEEGEGRTPLEDGNYVYNGSFDSDDNDIEGVEGVPFTDHWTYLHAGGGDATLNVNDGVLDVGIASGGNVEHGVQLLQSDIHLIEGATYRASFKAKAENERPVKVKIGGGESRGWADYADESPITISSTWEEYAFEFKMEHSTDANARYEFNMGLNDNGISLDDVRLEKVSDPDLSEMTRDPLPSGNHIFNGTFDQGEERMGYWTFNTDESAEASYYIGSAIDERRFESRITEGGDRFDSVQLVQEGFSLTGDREYMFTFDASSASERDIQVAFTDSDNETIHEETIHLTPDTEEHTIQFSMSAETDDDSAVHFNIGSEDSDVFIDNVFLERLPLELEVGNLLKNGIFDSLAEWRAEAYNPGQATFSVEDGQAKTAISSVGSEDWNIQLFQQDVNIEKDATYEVSFDARSTADRPLRVQIQRNGEADNIWTGYFDQTVSLTESLETFTFKFTMEEASDPSAKFGFALGMDAEGLTPEEAHDVFIDNVSVKVVEEEIEEPGTEDPETEDPGTEEPETEDPETEDPETEEPGTEDPETEEPGITEDPETEEPGAEDPETEDPEAEEPGADESETGEPAEEEITAGDTEEMTDKDGEKLPDTATSVYNNLVTGILALAAAAVISFKTRKKTTD